MEYVIEQLGEATKYHDLTPFLHLYDYFCDESSKPKCNGKDVLIVNEGGLQNGQLPISIKSILKGYNWQDNVFHLLPLLPKTATGKFTGKIELHTNDKYLEKIKFIPR